MNQLLVAVPIALGVVIACGLLLVTFRRKSKPPVPVDVEGWHRKLRILRDTAQPDADKAANTDTGDDVVVDTSERNVRLLPKGTKKLGEDDSAEGTGGGR